MWVIGGFLGSIVAVVPVWYVVRLATRNLPSSLGQPAQYAVVVLTVAVGFLAGAAIMRRARRSRHDLGLFSALAGSFAGGVIGCACALSVTAAYLGSYTSWPESIQDQILVILWYPVFGGVGLCIGAAFGLLLGTLIGGVFRLTSITR